MPALEENLWKLVVVSFVLIVEARQTVSIDEEESFGDCAHVKQVTFVRVEISALENALSVGLVLKILKFG